MRKYDQWKQELRRELEKLRKIKGKVDKSLKRAPDGAITVSVSNGVMQYYYRSEKGQKKGIYIEKKNHKLITALVQKEYDLSLQKEIEKQEKQIQKILKLFPEQDISEIYEKLSRGRKDLVNPHLLTDEEYVRQWLAVEYKGNPYESEYPLQKTDRGEMVRSKTEKFIADKLYAMKIPYRYEYPLQLNRKRTIYPDFTILKPDTREEVYLEHLGMMDRPEYAEKNVRKLQEYAQNQIYPGKQLLVTFENSTTPPDMDLTEQMLKEFINNLLLR